MASEDHTIRGPIWSNPWHPARTRLSRPRPVSDCDRSFSVDSSTTTLLADSSRFGSSLDLIQPSRVVVEDDRTDRGGSRGRLRWCPRRLVPERLRPRGSSSGKERPKEEVEQNDKLSSLLLKSVAVPAVTMTGGIRYMRLLTPDMDEVVDDTQICTIISDLSKRPYVPRPLNSGGSRLSDGPTSSGLSWRMSTGDSYRQAIDPYRQASDCYRQANDSYRQVSDPYRQASDRYRQTSGPTGNHRLRITDGGDGKEGDEHDAAVRDLLKDYNKRETQPRPPRLFIRDDPFSTDPVASTSMVAAVSGDESSRRDSEPQRRLTAVPSSDLTRRDSERQPRMGGAAVMENAPQTPARDREVMHTSRLPRYSSLSTSTPTKPTSTPSQQKRTGTNKGRRRSRDVGVMRVSGSGSKSPGTKPPRPAPLRLPFSPSSPIVVEPPAMMMMMIPSSPGPAPTKPLPAPPTDVNGRKNHRGRGRVPVRRKNETTPALSSSSSLSLSQVDVVGGKVQRGDEGMMMSDGDLITPLTATATTATGHPPSHSPSPSSAAETISPRNTNDMQLTSAEELVVKYERRKTWVRQKRALDLQSQSQN